MIKISSSLFLIVLLSLLQGLVLASSVKIQPAHLSILPLIFQALVIILNPFRHLSIFFKSGIPSSSDVFVSSRILILFSIYSFTYLLRLLAVNNVFSNTKIFSTLGVLVYGIVTACVLLSVFIAPWRIFVFFTNLTPNIVFTLVVSLFMSYHLISIQTLGYLIDTSDFLFPFLYFRLLFGQPSESPYWWRWHYRLFGVIIPAFCLLIDYNLKFFLMIALLHMFTSQLFVAWPILEDFEKNLLLAQAFLGLGRDIAISDTSDITGGFLSVLAIDQEAGSYVIPAFFEAIFLHLIIQILPVPRHPKGSPINKPIFLALFLYLLYTCWLGSIRSEDFWNFKPPIFMDSSKYDDLISQRERAEYGLLVLSAKKASTFFTCCTSFSISSIFFDFISMLFTRSTPFTFIISLMHGVFGYFSWEFYTFFILNVLSFEIMRTRCLITVVFWACTLYFTTPPFVKKDSVAKLSPVFFSKVILSFIQLILHIFIFPVGSFIWFTKALSLIKRADQFSLMGSFILSVFVFSCAEAENFMFSYARTQFTLPFLLTEFGIGSDGTFSASITTMDPSTTVDFPKKVSFYPLDRSPVSTLIERIVNKQKRAANPTVKKGDSPALPGASLLASSSSSESGINPKEHVAKSSLVDASSSTSFRKAAKIFSSSVISLLLATIIVI
ncbi:hypothetical protein MDAP_000411 [Mitosporidium daphniae]|uniref:Uncharacterized protein n=1 Tax=Mitosporidium daphniae TaxID=1485682 RepID=A0A098VUI2_9MICR|nr:uncharacterized protein DI09_168p30 [Mitosporidium daphniae]KGG52494.1 hypothetical protein DI09_168p30 [Mitosporidium daphniae]|eukprot:XP_013238930.1 uncharacterized protein DI09_168p30 [Mitosporidium daphniae]